MDLIIKNCKDYDDKSKNYGDCFYTIIDNNMLLYDCGSVEHALKIEEVIKKHGISNVVAVLSHNDSDHFDGFPYLIEKNIVSKVYGISPRNHLAELQRITGLSKEKLEKQIVDKYSNTESIDKNIVDIYNDSNDCITNILPNIDIVAPSYDYALEAIAKALDDKESDSIDDDTVKNAASVCILIKYKNKKILLTGDSSFDNIKPHLTNLTHVQCPHHGRDQQVDELFEFYKKCQREPIYLISDNTGDSNGGCDLRKFESSGRTYESTKNSISDVCIDLDKDEKPTGTFGI